METGSAHWKTYIIWSANIDVYIDLGWSDSSVPSLPVHQSHSNGQPGRWSAETHAASWSWKQHRWSSGIHAGELQASKAHRVAEMCPSRRHKYATVHLLPRATFVFKQCLFYKCRRKALSTFKHNTEKLLTAVWAYLEWYDLISVGWNTQEDSAFSYSKCNNP